MGTFDILNLRLNGYDFHVGLMAGKEKWTDPKVTAVFEKWKEFLPFHAEGLRRPGRGRTPRTRLVQKTSGMYLLGPVRVGPILGDQGRGRPRRPRLLPVPDPRHAVRRREGARRPDRHLQLTAKSPNARRRAAMPPRPTSSSGRRAHPGDLLQAPAGPHRRRPRTATPAAYSALQKKAGRGHRAPPERSPSSSTATRARTSPARRHAGLPPDFLANPAQDLAAYQKTHPGLLGLSSPRSSDARIS